jgi:hypothetical protein
MPPEPAAVPPVEWDALPVVLVLIPFSLLFVIWLQYINPRSAPVWRYPEWKINPFKLSEPLQFFHLGAFVCLAQGIGFLVKLAITRTPVFPEALIGVIMGAGTLLGVRLCTLVFRKKMGHGI